MKSWKTTAVGIIGALMAWGTALSALWDSDVTTEPNWGVAVSATIVAVGFLFSRDNNVTSEKAGAK